MSHPRNSRNSWAREQTPVTIPTQTPQPAIATLLLKRATAVGMKLYYTSGLGEMLLVACNNSIQWATCLLQMCSVFTYNLITVRLIHLVHS